MQLLLIIWRLSFKQDIHYGGKLTARKWIRVIVVCCLVAHTLIHVTIANQKIRQLDQRLTNLETKTISQAVNTKLKFDDVAQAIKKLNETQFENQFVTATLVDGDAQSETGGGVWIDTNDGVNAIHVGTDTNDGINDDHVGIDTYVHGAISNILRGFKDEKLVRKQAIATVQTDLLNVSGSLAADRDITAIMAEQLTTLLSSVQDTSESISFMNNSFDKSITEIKQYVTNQIQTVKETEDDKIVTTGNELETALSNIRKTLKESLQELKKSTNKYEEQFGRMAETVDKLERRSDRTEDVLRCLRRNPHLFACL